MISGASARDVAFHRKAVSATMGGVTSILRGGTKGVTACPWVGPHGCDLALSRLVVGGSFHNREFGTERCFIDDQVVGDCMYGDKLVSDALGPWSIPDASRWNATNARR